MKAQIGIVGLGRMGANMARRLVRGGHEVFVYNRSREKSVELQAEGATAAESIEDLADRLAVPRVIWMMLPAGAAVAEHVDAFSRILSPGDILVEGGNSFYKDDLKHAEVLAGRGIRYLDAGVSGGIHGLERGYCIMVGGEGEAFGQVEPFLRTLAPAEGYLLCGPTGAGHFAKMVHNGIEYAMMAAYGEGFDIINASPYSKHMPLEGLAHIWNRGSVISSWLLELLEGAFREDPGLDRIKSYVEDSGEGRWTVQQALETGTPAPLISMALFQRFQSRESNSFSGRVLAALRKAFGGHAVVNSQGTHADE
ncbi:MAG: decarboxylating 6-phosphogluconate dehydrogenase [Deltaproteobacteria bacterium]|nr:decarboxylating 6-phosphogluconate dehydrogenase [Deltaproteobacteria bacterium]